MKLERRRSFNDEFICELTKELDTLAGLDKRKGYDFYQHYILIDRPIQAVGTDKCLPIRVPGGTVGALWIDENKSIINVAIDTEYVVRTYPENINFTMEKYKGTIVEY